MRKPIHALVEDAHKNALEEEAVRRGLSLSKFVYQLLFEVTDGFTSFGGTDAGKDSRIGHRDVEGMSSEMGLEFSPST